jgi:hypothetical protein
MAVMKFKKDGLVVHKEFRPAREKETVVQGKVYLPRPDEFKIAVLVGERNAEKEFFFDTVPEVLTCQVALEDFARITDMPPVNMLLENNNGTNKILSIEGMTVISKESENEQRLAALMKAKGLDAMKTIKKENK